MLNMLSRAKYAIKKHSLSLENFCIMIWDISYDEKANQFSLLVILYDQKAIRYFL